MDLQRLLALSQSSDVPEGERWDINAEVLKAHLGDLAVHPEVFHELRGELALGKSLAEQSFGGLDLTAREFPLRDRRSKRISRLHVSELGTVSPWPGTRWTEKPDFMGFQALKWMVDHVFVYNLAINTRVRQAQMFCRPYRERSEYPYGMQIKRRDGQRLSLDDRKEVEKLQAFLDNCGDVEEPWERKRLGRDDFPSFVGKLVRNTLTYDWCPIEVELTHGGRPTGLYMIPPETVRLCSEQGYEGDDRIVALQLYETRVTALYEGPQIVTEVRNPRSDMLVGGYGYAETEMSVRIATALMNAFAFTAAGLDRNQLPRGILQLHGNYKAEELEYFKRQWNSLMNGPAARWRLPVLTSANRESGAVYTPVDTLFNEMAFAKWLSFLVSVICGLIGMSPEELNLDSFTSKAGGLSTAGQDTAERLASSKDKGLEPLLQFIARIYNEWIFPRLWFDKKYVLEFRGLHPVSPELQWQQKVALQTRDEARADLDMEPMEDPTLGEAPLDPGAAALYQQQQMFASGMMDPMGGMGGPGGGPGGDEEQPQLPDYIRGRLGANGADGAGQNPVSASGDPGPRNTGPGKLKAAKEATKSVLIVGDTGLSLQRDLSTASDRRLAAFNARTRALGAYVRALSRGAQVVTGIRRNDNWE